VEESAPEEKRESPAGPGRRSAARVIGGIRRRLPTLIAGAPSAVLLLFFTFCLAITVAWPEEATLAQPSRYLALCFLTALALLGLWALARTMGLPSPSFDLPRLRPFLAAIVLASIGVFTYLTATATQAGIDTMYDGAAYQQMGYSFVDSGEFKLWGAHSRHFPPLYPIYLSVFYKLDRTLLATKVAIEIIFLAAAATTFWCTRRLYSTDHALLACAAVLTMPAFLFPSSRNYGEPLVLLTFVLTIYGIMMSLKPGKRHYILLAGLCAGLGYLSKSSVGYFFIIAGMVGLGWRYYYMRREVVKDRWYLLAIAVFLSVFAAWSYRNISLFWTGNPAGLLDAWQTSHWFREAAKQALFREPFAYAAAIVTLAGFGSLLLSIYFTAFRGPLRESLRLFRDETVSGLWIAVVIPLVLGVVISGVFYVEEARTWNASNLNLRHFYNLSRYLFISLVPLVWLIAEVGRRRAGGSGTLAKGPAGGKESNAIRGPTVS
jgi:hypothetical protein